MSKIIGITIGDPSGIGPEVVIKSLKYFLEREKKLTFILFGDRYVFEKNQSLTGIYFKVNFIKGKDDIKEGAVNFLDLGIIKGEYPVGKVSRLCGEASFLYVEKGLEFAKKKIIDSLITAPVSKKAWNLAGYNFSGHTEMLSYYTKKDVCMVMVSGNLRAIPVTEHIPLSKIPSVLTSELIEKKVKIGLKFLKRLGIEKPVIGIACLNPHCGEDGTIGDEEKKIILPAVEKLKRENIDCFGPFSSDKIFREWIYGKYDIVVGMYHDQIMIPLKTFYFSKLINFTEGLPFPRVSPGHGTGFDISYKNIADPNPMIEAIKFCERLL